MKQKKYNNIAEIPNRKYQGYVWLSNATKPKFLNNEEYSFASIDENPFIVEALLFCETENVTVEIKHTDKYIISEYNLTEMGENAETVEKKYLPHRLDKVEKLKFNQFWEAKEDNLCEGMKSLQLKATVFTGFELKN